MRLKKVEIARNAVSREEMQHLRKSWYLSWDGLWLRDCGCRGRLVVLGWSFEVHDLLTQT